MKKIKTILDFFYPPFFLIIILFFIQKFYLILNLYTFNGIQITNYFNIFKIIIYSIKQDVYFLILLNLIYFLLKQFIENKNKIIDIFLYCFYFIFPTFLVANLIYFINFSKFFELSDIYQDFEFNTFLNLTLQYGYFPYSLIFVIILTFLLVYFDKKILKKISPYTNNLKLVSIIFLISIIVIPHPSIPGGFSQEFNNVFQNQFFTLANLFNQAPQKTVSFKKINLDSYSKKINYDNSITCSNCSVIIISMESMTNSNLNVYDNPIKLNPFLSSKINESILFTNYYSSEYMSAKVNMATIFGIPNYYAKGVRISNRWKFLDSPTLYTELKKNGYRTAHFNVDTLSYHGERSFIYNIPGIDVVVTGNDVNNNSFFSHNYAFEEKASLPHIINFIMNDSTPFFIFYDGTLGHASLEIPESYTEELKKIPGGLDSERNKAVYYMDSFISDIYDLLEKNDRLNNTLIIVTADHPPRPVPKNSIPKMPLILINPILFNTNSTSNNLITTIDIPYTLLNLLGIDIPEFWQGKNIFSQDENRNIFISDSLRWYLIDINKSHTSIYHMNTDEYYLFDNIDDPNFSKNLAGDNEIFLNSTKHYFYKKNEDRYHFLDNYRFIDFTT